MEARARAGIEIDGSALRYAEVEGYGQERPGQEGSHQYRLLRLGSCDFDFDASGALWPAGGEGASDAPTARQVATLGEALADVYESTAAEELRVAVHPPQASSFFAPAPAGSTEADRHERFRREAYLLARESVPAVKSAPGGRAEGAASVREAGVAEGLHLEAYALHADAEEQRQWYHVLAVSEATHARLRRIAEQLPVPVFRWTSSTSAAARVAAALQPRDAEAPAQAEAAPFTLAVGRYPGGLELALAREGRLFHATHAPRAVPADAAYFAAAFLERLEIAPASVGRVFAYGAGQDALPAALASLSRLVGATPECLDVRPVVGLDPDRLPKNFDAGLYVPCVGAAL